MKAIYEELHDNEMIIKVIKVHPFEYFWKYLIGIILLFTYYLTIVGIVFLVFVEIVRRSNNYYITNRRVIHIYSLFSKKSSSALYSKIQDLEYTQNFIERMLGIGKINIKTAGTGMVEIIFKGIKDPVYIKKIIERCMMHHS